MKKYLLCFLVSGNLFTHKLIAQTAVADPAGTATTVPAAACLACPGGIWNNETNVSVADGNPSFIDLTQNGTCFQSSCYYSRNLVCSQFGFSIPGTATIVGIEINILRDAPVINSIKDTTVQLIKNGVTGSSNYPSSVYWPLTYTYQTYGNPFDLWGLTWTPADINNPATAIRLAIYNQSAASVTGVNVDFVTMTVYYTTTTGIIESQTSVPNTFSVNQTGENEILFSFFSSDETSSTTLNVFDLTGKLVCRKEIGIMGAGQHQETVQVENLKSGIYLAQYVVGDEVISKKISIQK